MVFIGVAVILVAALGVAVLLGDQGGRGVAIGLLVLLVALSAFTVVVGWSMAYNSGRCDEACYPERGWAGTMDAWQWDWLFWSPAIGFVALLGVFVLVARRRYLSAFAALSVAALPFVAWAILWGPLTSEY